MSSLRIGEICQLLTRLQLVEPSRLDECTARLAPESQSTDLLDLLESKHLLTSFQVMRLAKGETDDLVLGRYKLLYRNASGSFARVYRVGTVDGGRMLGLKVLRKRWAEDPNMVSLFHREAELGRKLKHKNIVPIYEVGSQGDFHYFSMDFIVGGNLWDFIKIRKKLSPAEATRYALDMAAGLDYALSQGITHRDLKLTNVLMDTDGTAKMIDFGLAGHEGISGTAGVDGVQRALEYATLENCSNSPQNDPRSDLFFLGTIYYELLTGSPPYPRTRNREEKKQVSRYQNIRPVRSLDPNVPRSVEDIVERLLKLDPEQRLQKPADAVNDLQAVMAELGDAPQPAALVARPPAPDPKPNQQSLPTVMCIEHRSKQQNILREYLSKRGFRVLVLSDVQRGLGRLKSSPPDCVILMGGSIGREIVSAYQQAVQMGGPKSVVNIAVLAEKQARSKTKLEQSHIARVLVEPITLRDLRREIHVAFQRRLRQKKGDSQHNGDS